MIATNFFLSCILAAIQLQQTHSFSAVEKYDPNMKTKIACSVAKTERREVERSRVGREKCNRCIRPPELCVCQSLPEELINTSTTVLILQHPRERRRRSLSTVPLMPLVLKKCEVKSGYRFTPLQLDLVTEWLDKGQKPLLLFPGPPDSTLSLDDDIDVNVKNDSLQSLQNKEQLLILVSHTIIIHCSWYNKYKIQVICSLTKH